MKRGKKNVFFSFSSKQNSLFLLDLYMEFHSFLYVLYIEKKKKQSYDEIF